jgi:uncharacterized protein YbjT (DUF2867 family)
LRHSLVMFCALLLSCATFLSFEAWAADRPVVLVAGATGETGIHIVRALAAKGYAVRGLVRDPIKAKSQNGELAEWMLGDVRDPANLKQVFAGVSYAVSAIGSRERDGPNNFENIDWLGNRNLIDAAKTAGIKHFVLMTSGSAGVDAIDPNPRQFAGRIWKGKAEDYLRSSGLSYTVVAPGGLRNYAGGEKGILLRPRNQYAIGVIARDDVAAVMVECLTNPGCAAKTITTINTDQSKPGAWIAALGALSVDTPATIRLAKTSDAPERPLP